MLVLKSKRENKGNPRVYFANRLILTLCCLVWVEYEKMEHICQIPIFKCQKTFTNLWNYSSIIASIIIPFNMLCVYFHGENNNLQIRLTINQIIARVLYKPVTFSSILWILSEYYFIFKQTAFVNIVFNSVQLLRECMSHQYNMVWHLKKTWAR